MIVRYCGGSVWMNCFFFCFLCSLFSFLFFSLFLLSSLCFLCVGGVSVGTCVYYHCRKLNKMGLPLPKDLSSSEGEVTRS